MLKNLNLKQIQRIEKAINSFPYFVNNIFRFSFDKFIGGEYIDYVSSRLQESDRYIRVSAKDHFKSTGLYARFMWDILRFADVKMDREYHYFSYTDGLAGYHIKKIKGMILKNPYFEDLIDMKPLAETVISYSWDGKTKFTMEPQGMGKFKRGLHCNGGVFVDDPFQDPEKKLDPVKVYKVNDAMKTQIVDIPNKNAEPPAFLYVVGTPQTKDDFFFDRDFIQRFQVDILPAIKSVEKKEVLWPEWMDFEELMKRKSERGPKVFNQEYMCSPAYKENSFFNDEEIERIFKLSVNLPFNKRRSELDSDKFTEVDVIAGYDLGKKVHPAYFTVFDLRNGVWVQSHFKFFDKVDYNDQLKYIKEAIESLGIDFVYYDDTRNELETFREKGELPGEFQPVVLASKKRTALATAFDTLVGNAKILLIEDRRQKVSVQSVMNDLVTVENEAGHGEVFWGVCLALQFMVAPRPDIS